MADAESEDEDFAVDSQEMEEANNSSSDSEDEDQEAAVDVEEEDFTVQVKGGEIRKNEVRQYASGIFVIGGNRYVMIFLRRRLNHKKPCVR